jgi:hypothetical protein
MMLGAIAGFLFSLVSKRWFPPPVQQAVQLLTAALFTLLGAWLGFRVGKRVAQVMRFYRKVRLRTGDDFTLVYEATLEPHRETLYQFARRTQQEAEAFLQTQLERQTRFVVIAHEDTLSELRGGTLDVGGWADTNWDDVYVVFRDNFNDNDLGYLYRGLLHEWAHLITTRWNESPPTLFLEGIAVATAYHNKPQEAHAKALEYLRDSPNCSLVYLLDTQTFYDPNLRYAHYTWAGSFVLYLIERFGLTRFRHFYERLGQGEVDPLFQGVFGIGLEQAERLWREYLNTQMSESA